MEVRFAMPVIWYPWLDTSRSALAVGPVIDFWFQRETRKVSKIYQNHEIDQKQGIYMYLPRCLPW